MPAERASEYLNRQDAMSRLITERLGIPAEIVQAMGGPQFTENYHRALNASPNAFGTVGQEQDVVTPSRRPVPESLFGRARPEYPRTIAEQIENVNNNAPVTMPTAEQIRNRPIATEELTYGIEIECYLKNNPNGTPACERGAYHRGTQIPELPRGWNAQSDASLGHEEGYLAVEIVSPVLKGLAGMDQVREVCEYLKMKEAKVTDKCGFHVHVSLGRYHSTPANINKLVMLAKYWEAALYAITGTIRREEGAYCKSRPDQRVTSIINAPTLEGKAQVDERYRLLNLIPLATPKKTVEFRLFSGTTLFIKMAAYIQVALGLCEAATGPIAMSSLRLYPSGRLRDELNDHRYVGAVRELIRFLWRMPARPGNSKARGVVDPSIIVKCKDELMRLAKVYQGKKNRAE